LPLFPFVVEFVLWQWDEPEGQDGSDKKILIETVATLKKLFYTVEKGKVSK
jgi:hypothetical protein